MLLLGEERGGVDKVQPAIAKSMTDVMCACCGHSKCAVGARKTDLLWMSLPSPRIYILDKMRI